MDMGGPRTSLCCTRGQLRDDLTSCVKRNHWRIQVLLFAGTLAKMVSNGIASFLLYTDHILLCDTDAQDLVVIRENERSDEAWAGWPEQNSVSLCRTGMACH